MLKENGERHVHKPFDIHERDSQVMDYISYFSSSRGQQPEKSLDGLIELGGLRGMTTVHYPAKSYTKFRHFVSCMNCCPAHRIVCVQTSGYPVNPILGKHQASVSFLVELISTEHPSSPSGSELWAWWFWLHWTWSGSTMVPHTHQLENLGSSPVCHCGYRSLVNSNCASPV